MVWFHEVPYFSIISAAGVRLVGPTAITITPDVQLYGDPICIYNAIDNQYCVTWTGQNLDTQVSSTYFALINAAGTVATQAIAIPNISGQPTINFSDAWVSHNTQNDQYLFTWLAITEDEVANPVFAIYDAQANAIVPATPIRQNSLLSTTSYPIFSSYNSIDNQYFVTWTASAANESYNAYFALLDNAGRVAVGPL